MISAKQFCIKYNINWHTLRRWERKGVIKPTYKLGRKYYTDEEVKRWLDEINNKRS